jgi:microcystin-dependent protein
VPVINAGDAYRIGTSVVDRLYAGDTQVWPSGSEWPVGIIVHHIGSVAPEGWVICDGSPHGSAELQTLLGSANTPNLTDMFVRGAGTVAPLTPGGAATVSLAPAQMPSHSHAIGTQSANHTHTATSGGMSANGSHTHSATTGTVSAWHVHHSPALNTGGDSANHTHDINAREGVGEDADGGYLESNPDSQGTARDIGSLTNNSINHTHQRPAINSGNASVTHSHNFIGSSASVAHTHSVTTGLASAVHSHSVPSAGSGGAVPLVPPHLALIYVIKT